jgi:hypothetical protein
MTDLHKKHGELQSWCDHLTMRCERYEAALHDIATQTNLILSVDMATSLSARAGSALQREQK